MSLGAAKALVDSKTFYPASAAHCAYYACFQFMKHVTLCFIGKTEGELKAECALEKEGTHVHITALVVKYLAANKKEFIEFHTNIKELKRLRAEADYDNTIFGSDEAKKCLKISETVYKFLQNNCK